MSGSCRNAVDFEQWSALATDDPEAFERLRREFIESTIEAASARCQKRLRGLQWRIDQVRDHSANPMDACISLSNMMWDSFAGEDGLTEALNSPPIDREEQQDADVLPFVPKPE